MEVPLPESASGGAVVVPFPGRGAADGMLGSSNTLLIFNRHCDAATRSWSNERSSTREIDRNDNIQGANLDLSVFTDDGEEASYCG